MTRTTPAQGTIRASTGEAGDQTPSHLLDGHEWGVVDRLGAFDLQSFTVECWFRLATGPGEGAAHTLVSRLHRIRENVHDGWYLKIEGGSGSYRPFFAIFNGDAGVSVAGNRAILAGTWHHLAAVFDGAQLRVYQNGCLSGTSLHAGVISYASVPLVIGAQAYTQDAWLMRGGIADVRISRGARYTADFTPVHGIEVLDDATLAHWPMNDGQGPLFRDRGPHAQHGRWVRMSLPAPIWD
jgi:hypothetical protein